MKTKIINLLSIVIACIAFAVAVSIMEQWNPFSTEMPKDVSIESETFRIYMESQPTSAYMWIALGYAVGSIVAGWVLSRFNQHLSTSRITLSGGLMGVGVMNLLTIPHPTWFWLSLLIYFPCIYLGTKIFPKSIK
jgi:hypothetical protein